MRVSTEQQEAMGTSLATQERRCREAAALAGHTIGEGHVWREIASGTTLERPLLPDMLRAVSNGEVHVVLVYDADRLSRDPLHRVSVVTECSRHDVQIHFVSRISERREIRYSEETTVGRIFSEVTEEKSLLAIARDLNKESNAARKSWAFENKLRKGASC